jgi:hypothetical protein
MYLPVILVEIYVPKEPPFFHFFPDPLYIPGFSIIRQAETAQDEQNPAHLPVLQDLQDACLVLGSYPLAGSTTSSYTVS